MFRVVRSTTLHRSRRSKSTSEAKKLNDKKKKRERKGRERKGERERSSAKVRRRAKREQKRQTGKRAGRGGRIRRRISLVNREHERGRVVRGRKRWRTEVREAKRRRLRRQGGAVCITATKMLACIRALRLPIRRLKRVAGRHHLHTYM